MAERKRSRFWPFGGRDKTVAVPSRAGTEEDVSMKALASLSKIGTQTMPHRNNPSSANPDVSYELIRAISLKSEVVNAILRRTVDDTMGNGYRFDLADGVEEGDPAQLKVLQEFFKTPNPDDMGNEWLESLIFDLTLFGDAYLELDGSADTSSSSGQDWNFGGNLVSIWNIPADTIKLIPASRTPQPPNMAYIQTIRGDKRRFTSSKVLHISKYKQNRAYGSSPLIPLLNTIAGHLNLSNYINEMFTGTLPKTILNVGDISNAEMKTMLAMLEQQLSTGKSPFGLVAVNGGSGFQTHRLIDSVKDGQHLDLLYYYREEICAVFGIPPMKLGWVQTGKMSNPETQLDSWYDVVEAYQSRIQSMINNKILPLLKTTNYRFKFNTIRPSKEKIMADIIKAQGSGIAQLRQEGVISINEARNLLGLERIDSQDADNSFFLSPKLTINQRQNSLDEWEYDEDDWVMKAEVSKRTLTAQDRTPPQGVRDACKAGIKLFEDGFGGSGLEATTVKEARAMARGEPITVFKAGKMIRWWGRNARFLDEEKDSPAWTAAQLWGGRAGKSWAGKLKRAVDAEDKAAPEYVNNNECREDNETYDECISRGISYIMSREPDLPDEDAYAFAEQMCAIPCPIPDSDEDGS
tara:strand:+ start:22474 stop:24381 length:1908 start_codon:yes stop_codon:yes gene_type:complete